MLEDLYKRVLMEYAQSKKHRGCVDNVTFSITLNNPICGDKICLSLHVENDLIKDAKFLGDGCAISMASASLMIDAIKGKTLNEVDEMSRLFSSWMSGNNVDISQFPCEDIQVLSGVQKFPVRIKCAMLSWQALEKSLSQDGDGR